MPFDAELARAISDTFRTAVTNRLNDFQRLSFERLIQQLFGIKNLRNVQLWTRPGVQTRNFINRNLGEYELDLRTFLADRFIQLGEPTAPVKRRPFLLPVDDAGAKKFFDYLNDNFIREYCTRIFCTDRFIIIEYLADSDTPLEMPDLDSPEFDDIVE